MRLAENQVRNFPHRVTFDPYAAPDGQYVAVAPLLDTIIATAVVATQGRDATTAYIERVAALVPAIVGVLAVVAVWALATIAFDRRAGLIAGLLAAILPGHFLDRTLVGFVDHHALEVLLSFATLAALAYAAQRSRSTRLVDRCAGVSLGLYLLAWASGAYFVAILAVWIVLVAIVAPPAAAIVHGHQHGHHGGNRTGYRVVVPGPGAVPLQHAGRVGDGLTGRFAGGEVLCVSRWR